MNDKNFDDIIKQQADGHQSPVPPDAWDNISKKKKRKPYPVFWWSLSAIVLGVFTFLYLHNQQNNSGNKNIAGNPSIKNKEKKQAARNNSTKKINTDKKQLPVTDSDNNIKNNIPVADAQQKK